MKWIYRIVKHILIYLVVLLPLEILGIIILFPVCLTRSRTDTTLPYIFRWFQNRTLDGINGSESYKLDNKIHEVQNPSRLRLAYYRYVWLAFRNPLNYFQYNYIGIDLTKVSYIQTIPNNPIEIFLQARIGDLEGSRCGFRITEIHTLEDKKTYWELYLIYPYKLPFKDDPVCIRLRLGWKLGAYVEQKPTQYVLVFNPVMPFRGTCDHKGVVNGKFIERI